MSSRSAHCGFTLVELMVSITVIAILAIIAVPSFTGTIHRNDVSSASNTLLASLNYARSEAVTRGTVVSICPTTDGSNCAASTAAYETGWLVYTYSSGNAVLNTAYDSSSTTTNLLLRKVNAQSNVSIQSEDTSNILSFNSQGELRIDSKASGTEYAFVVCYRSSGDTGTGSSTTSVPGSEISISGAGSITTSRWGSGVACSAPTGIF